MKIEGMAGQPDGPGTSVNREEKKRSEKSEEAGNSEELDKPEDKTIDSEKKIETMDFKDTTSGEEHESGLDKVVKENALPTGWEVSEQNGRTVYLTPLPNRVKITCIAKLKEFKSRGRFSEINDSLLVFGRKRRKTSKAYNLEESKAVGCPSPKLLFLSAA